MYINVAPRARAALSATPRKRLLRVAESYRHPETRRPCMRLLAHLATVEDIDAPTPAEVRRVWARLDLAAARLGLSDDDARKLRAGLRRRIGPRPSDDPDAAAPSEAAPSEAAPASPRAESAPPRGA